MSGPRLLAGPLPGGDPVFGLSIADLQAAMAAGRLSSADLVRAYLARIAAYDQTGPALNAVLALNEEAFADAAQRDAERARGTLSGPLHGLPILLKDNIDTAAMPTTAGSLALARRRPSRDAAVVRRLREAGAIVLGKTTLHELACGITNVSSLSGRTRNAFNARRVPGGSSGGSAVAVASSFAAAAVGSDTSGSIRIPAAFNQVLGLRPTAGSCDMTGVVPLSPTLDTLGPMARTIDDLALLWSVMAGPDAVQEKVRRPDEAWRVGELAALFGQAPEEREISFHAREVLGRWQEKDAEVRPSGMAVEDARLAAANVTAYEFRDALAACLRDAGLPVRSLADILDGGYPHLEVRAILQQREAQRDPDGQGRQAALARAGTLRGEVLDELESKGLDLLAYPSVRKGPALRGEPQSGGNGLLASVTGLPALSVPVGFTPSGIPVGLELLGPPGSETMLLRAGESLLRAV